MIYIFDEMRLMNDQKIEKTAQNVSRLLTLLEFMLDDISWCHEWTDDALDLLFRKYEGVFAATTPCLDIRGSTLEERSYYMGCIKTGLELQREHFRWFLFSFAPNFVPADGDEELWRILSLTSASCP